MAGETLTVLTQHVTYTDGFLFINIITQEECYLTLLYSSVKPTRRRNPNIQEDQMKTHRWIFQMTEVHELPDAVSLPLTVHNFEFRFPELNDTIWFSAVYHDIPREESPQAPIFAWRVPLTLIQTQLWTEDLFLKNWGTTTAGATPSANLTPGRLALTAPAGPGNLAAAATSPVTGDNVYPPPNLSWFVLLDALYNPTNLDPQSALYTELSWLDFNTFEFRFTFQYGDINTDPCLFSPSGFFGNWQPHVPHLFALDLQMTAAVDLCGNPQPVLAAPTLYAWTINLRNEAPADGPPIARETLRPWAIYTRNGPMQDISRHWWYLRPLLPQKKSPQFTQPNYRTAP